MYSVVPFLCDNGRLEPIGIGSVGLQVAQNLAECQECFRVGNCFFLLSDHRTHNEQAIESIKTPKI